MRKILIGALITITLVLIFRSCSEGKEEISILQENSMLIRLQIEQVSKLIVTEGHFSEVYNYKDSQQLFGALITANKRALVVVNAEVTIAYDLSEIDFEVDEATKTLRIKSIPEPEVKINPDYEYYDVTADYFNPFTGQDYNRIKKNVNASLMRKVEASSLKSNAQNRLLSELQKFYMLTNAMGWSLEYQDQIVDQNLQALLLKD